MDASNLGPGAWLGLALLAGYGAWLWAFFSRVRPRAMAALGRRLGAADGHGLRTARREGAAGDGRARRRDRAFDGGKARLSVLAALLQRDDPAAEACFHRFCFRWRHVPCPLLNALLM